MSDQFQEKAKTWDTVPWKIKLAESVSKLIKKNKNINSESHLVDIGGGTGLLTLKFKNDVQKITVIDSSKSMLDVLRDKLVINGLSNIDIIEGFFTSKTFPDDSIDIFISMLTLHHIPNIEGFLSAIYRALKPGGSFIFIDLETEAGDFHMDGVEYAHNGFDPHEIMLQLTSSGFSQIRVTPSFSITKKSKYGLEKNYPVLFMEGSK